MLLKKSRFTLKTILCNNHYANINLTLTKNFILGKLAIHGRNNSGKITVFNRGSAVKRKYRIVDFLRYIWNVKAQLLTAEYDPNRTSLISLLLYTHNVLCYVLTIGGAVISTTIESGGVFIANQSDKGYCSHLKKIKPGSFVNSIEAHLLRGAKYVRAGGCYAKLVSLTATHAIIKLRSQFLFKINNSCIATVGVLSLSRPIKTNYMCKAGFSRRRGIRPSVRGVAKNPVDHPHGGGQGKTSGGRTSVTPWAEITKGRRTRRKINYGKIILKR